MARKPADIVQPNLRIREGLRRELKREADKNRVSLNVEMVRRLERSLDQEDLLTAATVAADLNNLHGRYGPLLHELNKQGDLIRAAEALLKQIEQSASSAAIAKAAEKVKQVIEFIERDAAALPRQMHTTGADQ